MPLTTEERRQLTEVHRRTSDGQTIELVDDKHISYWLGLEKRGYVKLSKTAKSLLGTVHGEFLSMTESGQEALKANPSK